MRPLQLAMLGQDPRATMAAVLAGLPESLQTALVSEKTTTFPNGEPKFTFHRFSLKPLPDQPVSAQDLSHGLTLARQSLSPMTVEERRRLLMRLRVKTRVKAEGDDVAVFQVEVYAEDLSQWPADVVRLVLTTWPDSSTWWPSWKELLDVMEPLVLKRRALVEVLEQNPGAGEGIGDRAE